MIDTTRADAMDELAMQIQTLPGQDDAVDAQLANLIADVMQTIDGRTLATGFKYTLNVTNALQLRAKHWFIELNEWNIHNPNTSSVYPAQTGFDLVMDVPPGWTYSANSYGNTIGISTCSAILKVWAIIVRTWLAGNYPLAVTQPIEGTNNA